MGTQTKSALTISACLLILAVLLAAGMATFLGPCAAHEDGSWMTCHWAGQAVMSLGVLMGLFGVIRLLLGEKARAAMDWATLAAALVTLRMPGGVIATCSMAAMRCNAVTRPATLVICVLIIALCVSDLLLARKKG